MINHFRHPHILRVLRPAACIRRSGRKAAGLSPTSLQEIANKFRRRSSISLWIHFQENHFLQFMNWYELYSFFLCGGWYARISNPLRHNTFGAHSRGHQQWLAASCDLEGMERNGVKCDRARIVVTFTYFLYIIYFYILVTTMIMI